MKPDDKKINAEWDTSKWCTNKACIEYRDEHGPGGPWKFNCHFGYKNISQVILCSARNEVKKLIHTDGIFSCDKCGDSGTIRNPDFVLRFGNGPNEKPQFIDCSCRTNPMSILYLQSKARK
jgi:hypothetical protein